MKKLLLILIVVGFFQIHAQIKVGNNAKTINPNALFEMESDSLGMILPRISLQGMVRPAPLKAHIKGMHVYNLTNAFLNTDTALIEGEYYNDGNKWNRIVKNSPVHNFFYSPSISIPVATLQTNAVLDLYGIYASQFNSPSKKNASAPAKIPVYSSNQLNYYVTYFDGTIIDVKSITDAGVMTYDVISTDVNSCSYVNVVFTIKN